ncbi:hypothetical protein F8A87_05895 [Betaproteobacteria bacterium SCN2]|jgi:hypothetical protein|nr:hypothetical protein F8A87_05895 [Betaproteobacteria bacterium SCN2]
MAQTEILILSSVRLLVEIAGYSLLGQGLLYMLAGAKRDQNMFYGILKTITSPVIRATRFITPRFVIDAHIPFVAFFLLFWIWIGVSIAKRYVCLTNGLQC